MLNEEWLLCSAGNCVGLVDWREKWLYIITTCTT